MFQLKPCVVCPPAAAWEAWAVWAPWRAWVWAWRAPLPRTTAAALACRSTCSRTRPRTWCTRTPRTPRIIRTRTSTRSTSGTPTDCHRHACTEPGCERPSRGARRLTASPPPVSAPEAPGNSNSLTFTNRVSPQKCETILLVYNSNCGL